MDIYNKEIEINEMTRSKELRKNTNLIIICPFYINNILEYIENLKYQDEKYLSYNYIIEENGSVINIVSVDEVSYSTSNIELNLISISIGVFIEDKYKEMNKKVENSLCLLLKMLCDKYNLDVKSDIKIAYDIFNTREFEYYIDNYFKWENIIKEI